MGVSVASGLTTHSGTYTPEIWSMKTLLKFYEKTVFGAIANTEYEGEIKAMGDTVHISIIPDILIKDYSIGQELEVETPTPSDIELVIDKAKYYNFLGEDIQKKQSHINFLDKWANDAAEQFKITIDSSVLADIYADAHANNKGLTAGTISGDIDLGVTGTPLSLDKTNILDTIVDCGTVLDEQQGIPENDRWIVLSARLCGLIKKSDLKDASLAGDGTSIMRNGRIGMIDRFTIYQSNQLTTSSDGGNTVYNCIFGHLSALTFATQLTETESLRSEKFFGELFRGLQVYGYKVIKATSLGHLYAYKG